MATKETAVIISIPATEKQVSPLIMRTVKLEVTDEKTKAEAATMLNDLTAFQKKVVAYKEAKTKPLNQALKVIRDETRELEGDLKTAIDATRAKLSVYQTEQLRLARIEEDKIAARVGEGKGKFTAETAVRKIDELDKPSGTVSTGNGEVKFRTAQNVVITDRIEVVKWLANNGFTEMLEFSETALKKRMLEGNAVAGAHIKEVQEAASYRG